MEYYFGTGGLVRAYSDALSGAIANAEIVSKDIGYIAKIKVGYSDVEKLKYYFNLQNIKIINTEFDENVIFTFEIQKHKYEEILSKKEDLNFKILEIQNTQEKYIEVL